MISEGFWGLRASWKMRRRRDDILFFCFADFGLSENGGGVVGVALRCGSRGLVCRWSWCADSMYVLLIRSITRARGLGMRSLIDKEQQCADAMLKM